jgi:predicted nucleotidyltransferase
MVSAMVSALPAIAMELGADERTLRRATARGTVRARRPRARQLELPAGELDYLRAHWGLLHKLTAALRTEPNVALATLYGSAARGDDHSRSDIDLLVAFRNDAPEAASALARRLERALQRPVDVARLSRVRDAAPLLLLQALDEGRVLVDRDGAWPRMLGARRATARAAARQMAIDRRAAARSLDRLLAEEF